MLQRHMIARGCLGTRACLHMSWHQAGISAGAGKPHPPLVQQRETETITIKLTWYVMGRPAAAALARILPTTVADRSVHVILEKPSAASAAPMPLLPQPSSRMASQGLMCGATTCRNSL